MSVPILTAISDAGCEAELATAMTDVEHGVQIVRRCVDLADALAAAAAGLAKAVVVSADLRRLDRDSLSQLALARVAVVGLVPLGDDAGERRLRQLGVQHLVPYGSSAAEVSAAVMTAVGDLAAVDPGVVMVADGVIDPVTTAGVNPAIGWSDPVGVVAPASAAPAEITAITSASMPPATATPRSARDRPVASMGDGRIVAVWGPAGAPGRSTVAVNLAAEFADLGHSTLLVDIDTYGGAVAQLLGVLDEAPGFAAACRLANTGDLDAERLAGVAVDVRPCLRALTGITRPQRWLELRPAAVRAVLELVRVFASITVVDCGFCLEQDEELAYDTAAPRRNGATLTALTVADVVLGVAAADPVGLARYVRASPDCAALSAALPVTVVNRLRKGVVGPGRPRREVAAALDRYAGITARHFVPEDRDALDATLAAGRLLVEAAPRSPARAAIRAIAVELVGALH
jgi:MinD-like ATPase involved in chromosome partitioning or flagellar assembly